MTQQQPRYHSGSNRTTSDEVAQQTRPSYDAEWEEVEGESIPTVPNDDTMPWFAGTNDSEFSSDYQSDYAGDNHIESSSDDDGVFEYPQWSHWTGAPYQYQSDVYDWHSHTLPSDEFLREFYRSRVPSASNPTVTPPPPPLGSNPRPSLDHPATTAPVLDQLETAMAVLVVAVITPLLVATLCLYGVLSLVLSMILSAAVFLATHLSTMHDVQESHQRMHTLRHQQQQQ